MEELLWLNVLCTAEAGLSTARLFSEEGVSLCAAGAAEMTSMNNAQGKRVPILRIAIKNRQLVEHFSDL